MKTFKAILFTFRFWINWPFIVLAKAAMADALQEQWDALLDLARVPHGTLAAEWLKLRCAMLNLKISMLAALLDNLTAWRRK